MNENTQQGALRGLSIRLGNACAALQMQANALSRRTETEVSIPLLDEFCQIRDGLNELVSADDPSDQDRDDNV